ncbi:flavonoid 3',5'-hydroxylase 1-like [Curcuma longa]|uniref:flavonoid 3',5'-hydroxylase 1-like n=1 Tax=Curcuma longa TaxID=136217 RepID=UPI003D9DBB24
MAAARIEYSYVLGGAAALLLALHLLLNRWLLRKPRSHLPLPPGPRGVPVLGALPLIGASAHSNLARLAARYGPIMSLRLGSHLGVVVSDASSARAFLKTADAQFAHRPDNISARDVSYQRHNLVMSDATPTWKHMRKLCSLHLLGGKALTDWAPTRRAEFRRLVDALRRLHDAGEPVPLIGLLICTLVNIMGTIAVSGRVFDDYGDESNKFKDVLSDMLTGGAQFNVGDFFPSIAWMDLQGIQAKMLNVHKRLDALVTRKFEEHQRTRESRRGAPDFIDKVMANKVSEDGTAISDVNVRALIFDLFTAGTDTSSIVVEWTLAEMLRNPAILHRLQAETEAVVGRDRLLEESDIPNLPYLQAVCKEALRLHPSTPLMLPHFSHEDCEVGGFFIPKHTRLLVNVWAIGRDPAVWENPLAFDPDRFLPGGKGARYDPLGSDGNFGFIPFGAGRRSCTAKLVGMLFVQYLVGTLAHAFDWELPEGEEEIDMEAKPGLVLPKAVPLKAFARPRLSPAAYV